MTNAKWLGGLLLIAVMVSACQKEQTKIAQPAENSREASLKRIATLAEQAEIQAQADIYESDQTYQVIFQKLDSLRAVYPGDSGLVHLQDSLEQKYDQMLAETESPEDSLSAESVLEELNLIYQDMSDSALALQPDSGLVAARDSIPVVMNRNVRQAIKYFTRGRGKRIFKRWMQRAGKWEGLIKPILRKENAPEDLFYLAMIESGLNPKAHSYARAMGMWQFIYGTGKAYGLHRSWWFDERRDPVKATTAAARHLLDLYERFGDWYLAIAGYNFNPRKIEKRLARYNVSEFWDLPRLPRQTRNYVPTFLAALTIAKDPARYGFDEIIPEEPIKFDTVTVRECVDLNVVAECVERTFKELKELNPALLRFCTPPDQEKWLLNLPANTRDTFLANYAKVPKERKVSWVRHRIRSGETLSTIARKYRVSVSEIKRFNRIRGTMIRAGHSLVIPVPQNKKYYQNYIASQRSTRTYRKPKPVTSVPGREKHVYLIKKGDSLWDIATRYGVTITQLRQWNGLGRSRIIRPGNTLNIWLPPGASAIPDAPNTSVAENQPVQSPAKPAATGGSRMLLHTVRSGDTLWDIAQSYNVSIRDIKRWNDMHSNTIRPGDQLKIFAE